MVTSRDVPRQAGEGSHVYLNEVEAKSLLQAGGIKVVETKLAVSRREAIIASKQLGFPVVLKVVSPGIVHKSDIGGVRLSLNNITQVGQAYAEIVAGVKRHSARARITGMAVQKMVPPATEVIIGMSRDPQFGPVLMFGLGGIWAEVLQDVSFRIVPITRKDARAMVEEVRGYPVLQGRRGQASIRLGCLEDLLLQVSGFIEKHPEIGEMDLNPVSLYRDDAVVLDARIVLDHGLSAMAGRQA
jgi:acyl-CoA synthetase (NDP forming)